MKVVESIVSDGSKEYDNIWKIKQEDGKGVFVAWNNDEVYTSRDNYNRILEMNKHRELLRQINEDNQRALNGIKDKYLYKIAKYTFENNMIVYKQVLKSYWGEEL